MKCDALLQTCPHCKTMITKNVRYSNLIKERYDAVCEVKKRVFGEMDRIERNRNQNMLKLMELAGITSGTILLHSSPIWSRIASCKRIVGYEYRKVKKRITLLLNS